VPSETPIWICNRDDKVNSQAADWLCGAPLHAASMCAMTARGGYLCRRHATNICRGVVALCSSQVNDVLNGMIKRNILSVPVLLKTNKYCQCKLASTDGDRPHVRRVHLTRVASPPVRCRLLIDGFLDLMDIVRYVVSHFGAKELAKERSFFDLLKEEKKFAETTVGELMSDRRGQDGSNGIDDAHCSGSIRERS
jgi:hypothetical protein